MSVDAPQAAQPENAPPNRDGDSERRITPLWLLKNFEEVVSCLGLVLIIVVVTINVTLRYFFARSIAWAEEVSVIGFSCVIFIGSAAVYKRNMHVGIDFVVNLLPALWQRILFIVTKLFLLVFTAYVAYLGWIYSMAAWDKPTSILFIPYFFINFPICVGFASMAVYSLIDCVALLRGRGESGELNGGAA